MNTRVVIAPFESNGLIRRLAILAHAWWHQSDVTHETGDIQFAAILMRPRRTVLTILDCIDVDSKRGWAGWAYRKLWFEWPVRRCSVVTTISEASKRDIVRVTGCDPAKIVVTSVAVSSRFQRCDRDFNQQYPRILQVGAAPNKNIERLSAALKGIPCKLIIIGSLNESQLNALHDSNIDYENRSGLSDNEMYAEYVQSDIIAFASVLEGFGMPIVEGNLVGRAVVTSNCTSMPEVAGHAACIVDPFDENSIRSGFLRVINDHDYRIQLIQRGFANAMRFDPESVARKYLEIYQRVDAGMTFTLSNQSTLSSFKKNA